MIPKNLKKDIWFTMQDNQQSENHLEIYIYGIIGWDITAEEFISNLNRYKNLKAITVYIFSVGGTFESGLPIFNALHQHPAEVTAVVMGYALSMASYIMLAADKVTAANNALIMIHRAQGYAYGSPDELIKAANILELHEKASITEYDKRLKIGSDAVLALLQAETWYSAQSALDAGLIDEIVDAIDTKPIEKAMPSNVWQFAKEHYQHVPETIENKLKNPSLIEKFLNAVVGEKPLPLPPPTDEIEMSPEELKAALAENNATIIGEVDKKIQAAMLAAKPIESPPPSEAELLATANAEIDRLQAENLALKTPANHQDLPENTGGVPDIDNTWA